MNGRQIGRGDGRPWTAFDDKELRRLWGFNLKTATVARRLGRCVGTIQEHRVKLGLPPRKRQ